MMMNPLSHIDNEFYLVIQQERELNSQVSNTIPPVGNKYKLIWDILVVRMVTITHSTVNLKGTMVLEVMLESSLIVIGQTIPLKLASSNMNFHQVTRAKERVMVL